VKSYQVTYCLHAAVVVYNFWQATRLDSVSKNAPTSKRYGSELQWSILMIFGRNIQSKVSRIEFACFSFHVGLLFLINFSSFRPDTVTLSSLGDRLLRGCSDRATICRCQLVAPFSQIFHYYRPPPRYGDSERPLCFTSASILISFRTHIVCGILETIPYYYYYYYYY